MTSQSERTGLKRSKSGSAKATKTQLHAVTLKAVANTATWYFLIDSATQEVTPPIKKDQQIKSTRVITWGGSPGPKKYAIPAPAPAVDKPMINRVAVEILCRRSIRLFAIKLPTSAAAAG